MRQKIQSIENLTNIVLKGKKKGKKIVLCHGVFDLLHIGHIKHFNRAKSYGDLLVVSVTCDKYVNKGPYRPAFNEQHRLEAIQALDAVDFVVLSKYPSATNLINELKPNVYCKGKDYKNIAEDITGEIKKEIKAIKKVGGKIIFTQDITFSSSKIINNFGNIYPSQHKSIINRVKKKYSIKKINKLIEDFKKLKVLVIGETIIDQYFFCETLGKSGKEPILVLRDLKSERYLGGAGAICRHLSSFSKQITLLSMVGEKGEQIKEIKKKLPKNVDFKYIKKFGSPTIIKKRFLDHLSFHKIFGVDSVNDDFLNKKNEKSFFKLLKVNLLKHDLIIVSDYGHGLISDKSASLISKLSKYLALNAQVNAANVGYHSMSKYKNLDCLIVNEKELRHEMRDKKNKIESLMKKFAMQQNIKDVVATQGVTGSLLYNKKNNHFNYCQAFAKNAIDKVGAGDSMLSLIALCLKSKFDKNLAMLISSLGAAQSVKSIGNKEALNKIKIFKAISHLLK
tara:strand:- start:142 stop:1665 length:1524 start_codon:yes stop_codon:yes gene_type:complete